MKVISLNKRDLVSAVAYSTHVDFDGTDWQWQVAFKPEQPMAEARVVIANPTVEPDVSYTLLGEETFDPFDFVDIDRDFAWGEVRTAGPRGVKTIKDIEDIQIEDDVRARIEKNLRKHVDLGGDMFSVRYY